MVEKSYSARLYVLPFVSAASQYLAHLRSTDSCTSLLHPPGEHVLSLTLCEVPHRQTISVIRRWGRTSGWRICRCTGVSCSKSSIGEIL